MWPGRPAAACPCNPSFCRRRKAADKILNGVIVITTVLLILIAVLLFGLIIFVHEFGHFITAKAMGVKVNEFAIGMGPTLFKFQKGETKYALRLFPIGGFCAMEGEDEASEDARAFGNKKV